MGPAARPRWKRRRSPAAGNRSARRRCDRPLSLRKRLPLCEGRPRPDDPSRSVLAARLRGIVPLGLVIGMVTIVIGEDRPKPGLFSSQRGAMIGRDRPAGGEVNRTLKRTCELDIFIYGCVLHCT